MSYRLSNRSHAYPIVMVSKSTMLPAVITMLPAVIKLLAGPCPGHSRSGCQHITASTETPQKQQLQQREHLTRAEEVPDRPAPRSPFNTGSMSITTAGATQSLCGHDLLIEKTIVIVRHGLTTWNEESRIQARSWLRLATGSTRNRFSTAIMVGSGNC